MSRYGVECARGAVPTALPTADTALRLPAVLLPTPPAPPSMPYSQQFAALQLVTPVVHRRHSALQEPHAYPVSPIQLERSSGSTVEETSTNAVAPCHRQQPEAPTTGQEQQLAEAEMVSQADAELDQSHQQGQGSSSGPPSLSAAASFLPATTASPGASVVLVNLFVDNSRTEELERELISLRSMLSLLQAQATAAGDTRAREAGALRAQVARLEGAVQAGESRVRAQATEAEALRVENVRLERQLAELQAAAAVTPDKARAEKENLTANLAAAQADAAAKATQLDRLQLVAAWDASERAMLDAFAAKEWQILTEQERELVMAVGQAEEQLSIVQTEAAAAMQRAADTEAALAKANAALAAAREEAQATQEAVAAAEQQATEWRVQAAEMDRDRQAAAANLRKAEREVDLVAQENEALFRQINFVRSRLAAQQGLDLACPELGKLARELSAWYEREAAARTKLRA